MKFRYKKLGPGVLRPIIPVQLEHAGFVLSYEVLVDSGADCCVFDAEIGEALGIDVESGVQGAVSGLTGTSEMQYFHDITLRVGGHPHRARVGFLRNIGRYGHGIVGQAGFFDHYVVIFNLPNVNLPKEEVDLRPHRGR